MSFTRSVVGGLCWLTLAGAPQGLDGWRSAQAQPQTPAKPSDKPADRPAGEPAHKPQVRTYSTVTVVDDPKLVPPLPTGRKASPAAEPRPPAAVKSAASSPPEERKAPAETLPDGRDVPAVPQPERPAHGDLKQLRHDLHDLRQEKRHGTTDDRDPAASPATATKNREDSEKHTERNLRERGHGSHD